MAVPVGSSPLILDTNVLIYSALRVDGFIERADAYVEATEVIRLPESALAEIANVVWMYVRRGRLAASMAIDTIRDIHSLIGEVVAVPDLWEDAMRLACETAHPVYDTLFVVLAQRHATLVATFDRTLARRFPKWTAYLGA